MVAFRKFFIPHPHDAKHQNLPLRGDSPGGGNVTGGDKRGALVAWRSHDGEVKEGTSVPYRTACTHLSVAFGASSPQVSTDLIELAWERPKAPLCKGSCHRQVTEGLCSKMLRIW